MLENAERESRPPPADAIQHPERFSPDVALSDAFVDSNLQKSLKRKWLDANGTKFRVAQGTTQLSGGAYVDTINV